jgi:hypothetical protein
MPEKITSELLRFYASETHDASVPEHLSQCQSLTLYQGFCAMKYAVYALCVNSHQHSQCQDCRDSASEDLALVEPGSDSLPSPGTALPCPWHTQTPSPVTALCGYHFLPGWSTLDLEVLRNDCAHLSTSASKGPVYILTDLTLII